MNTMQHDETTNVTVRSIIAAISTFAVVGAMESSLPGTAFFALLSLGAIFSLTIALLLPMNTNSVKTENRKLAGQSA